ncbi:MAG: hypothetical protein IJG52_05555 [Lachnospiraceae bacterium]|nr:hypothetical protein [Lachnospiraceae bacterium]
MEKRLLTIDEVCSYTSMGRSFCREWLKEHNAVRKISGKMVRYDRKIIDQALDAMAKGDEQGDIRKVDGGA